VIVSQVPELLDCDRCTLFFVDLERQDLIVTRGASHGKPKSLVSWIFGQSNAPELPFSPGTDELRFPMSKGIAGHVGLTGETLNIRDAHEDPRFNPEFDTATGYRTRSVLCMPMRDSKGTVIGVVQAINKNPGAGSFTPEDETVLEIFTEQAAVAVKNSELYETTRLALDRSEALLEVKSTDYSISLSMHHTPFTSGHPILLR
jgi:GAF domain-containing protein